MNDEFTNRPNFNGSEAPAYEADYTFVTFDERKTLTNNRIFRCICGAVIIALCAIMGITYKNEVSTNNSLAQAKATVSSSRARLDDVRQAVDDRKNSIDIDTYARNKLGMVSADDGSTVEIILSEIAE